MRIIDFGRQFMRALQSQRPISQPTSMQTVFVYGTLKQGQPNHYLMTPGTSEGGRATFLCRARTVAKYPLVIAGRCHVPYLLDAPGKGKYIEGEAWNVDDAMLTRLDELENHPAYYQRDVIALHMLNGDDTVDTHADCEENVLVEKECLTYFLRNYKPELESLPMLQGFDANKGEKRYIPVKDRAPGDTLNQGHDVLVAYNP